MEWQELLEAEFIVDINGKCKSKVFRKEIELVDDFETHKSSIDWYDVLEFLNDTELYEEYPTKQNFCTQEIWVDENFEPAEPNEEGSYKAILYSIISYKDGEEGFWSKNDIWY